MPAIVANSTWIDIEHAIGITLNTQDMAMATYEHMGVVCADDLLHVRVVGRWDPRDVGDANTEALVLKLLCMWVCDPQHTAVDVPIDDFDRLKVR